MIINFIGFHENTFLEIIKTSLIQDVIPVKTGIHLLPLHLIEQKCTFEALNMKQGKGENLDIGFD